MDFDRARETMVDSQIRPNDVAEPGIVAAFMKTPREVFVPDTRRSVAYSELEIVTSPGRALWIPRDTAKLIKLADFAPADTVLIIGAGAGYEAALISHLVAKVLALEESAALATEMTQRFAALGIDRAFAVEGPLAAGLPQQAPFDAIYVAGMIESVPKGWLDQLRDGGRLAAVVADVGGIGRGTVFTRAGETCSARQGFDASPPRFSAFDRKPAFSF